MKSGWSFIQFSKCINTLFLAAFISACENGVSICPIVITISETFSNNKFCTSSSIIVLSVDATKSAAKICITSSFYFSQQRRRLSTYSEIWSKLYEFIPSDSTNGLGLKKYSPGFENKGEN